MISSPTSYSHQSAYIRFSQSDMGRLPESSVPFLKEEIEEWIKSKNVLRLLRKRYQKKIRAIVKIGGEAGDIYQ